MRGKPSYLLLSSLVAPILLFCGPALAQGALDGRAFSVVSTNPDEPFPDHLVFAGGQFESMGCRPFGFGSAAYTATESSGATTFDATTTSPTEGTMVWNGQVMADGTIAGTFTWTKEGQDPVTASWAGNAAAGPLDGHAYAITIEGETQVDTLEFANGAFESVGCRQYGFFPVAYQAAPGADGSTTFSVTTYSFTEGTIAWTGTVTGQEGVQGTFVWSKEGQEPATYTFRGGELHTLTHTP